MGETRDPWRGSWSVFEGDTSLTNRDQACWQKINSDIVWPLTFRFFRLHSNDAPSESFEIELNEDLSWSLTCWHGDLRKEEDPDAIDLHVDFPAPIFDSRVIDSLRHLSETLEARSSPRCIAGC